MSDISNIFRVIKVDANQQHAMATRSAYVSRVRRAFFLRAHPDRFRSHAPQIRKQQAGLIQVISERMGRPDFLSYAYGGNEESSMIQPIYPSLDYVLEQKDGSLKNYSLDLNDSVEGVLESMVSALQENGLTTLAPPPKALPSMQEQQTSPDDIHWGSGTKVTRYIDHQFDINWNQGRDLRHFLASLDSNEIASRKASRIDVVAIASVVRKEYQFSAVDGTGLGWSSASLAVLLGKLLDLSQEHSHKFHVSSFYPLRLVWSSEDQPLDLYGGNLYLNPAATPIQWLDHLLRVTPKALTFHKECRTRLIDAGQHVSNFLGVTFHKGHSCSSREYFEFLVRLACMAKGQNLPDNDTATTTTSIALERVNVMVESPQACRRPSLTKEGNVLVGAGMTNNDVITAVTNFLPKAREKMSQSNLEKEMAQMTIKQVKWEFGLQQIQYSKFVSDKEFVEALIRLVRLEEREELKQKFTGNSLGIVSTGQFCHLGDDGSLMIPWDWS